MSRNLGFQITDEDVENVLTSYSVNSVDEDKIREIMSKIDDDLVSSAALSVEFLMDEDDEDILNRQTEAAYNEIARQLKDLGYIGIKNQTKFGNKLI